jgi:hypothetical protein
MEFCVCQGFKILICQNISLIHLLICIWRWVITPHKSIFCFVGHFDHLLFTFWKQMDNCSFRPFEPLGLNMMGEGTHTLWELKCSRSWCIYLKKKHLKNLKLDFRTILSLSLGCKFVHLYGSILVLNFEHISSKKKLLAFGFVKWLY